MSEVNSEWAKMIARYPERYGRLSQLFRQLLDSIEEDQVSNTLVYVNVPYYRNKFRSINSDGPTIDIDHQPVP